jgi:multiple sugar transport system ATP-binding protein
LTEDVKELAQDMDAVAVRSLEDGGAKTTMVGRFGARSRIKLGEEVEIAVDTRTLHFFDPDTGLGIYANDSTKGVV